MSCRTWVINSKDKSCLYKCWTLYKLPLWRIKVTLITYNLSWEKNGFLAKKNSGEFCWLLAYFYIIFFNVGAPKCTFYNLLDPLIERVEEVLAVINQQVSPVFNFGNWISLFRGDSRMRTNQGVLCWIRHDQFLLIIDRWSCVKLLPL